MNKLGLLLRLSVANGHSLPEALGFALDYKSRAVWCSTFNGQGWIFDQKIILHHREPMKENGKFWRGNIGKYEGLILTVMYVDERFYLLDLKEFHKKVVLEFSPADIVDWWIPGNKIEFFRADVGWVELDSVYYLPPTIERK